MSYKTYMHGGRESHSGIVPAKQSNAGQGGPQEIVEGRPLTEENAAEPNPYRIPSRESGPSGLDRVRQAAQRDKRLRFTAPLHHVNIDLLRGSYYDLKRRADDLEERLADLHGRIHRGAYRARPWRRVWIGKDDGRKRPLGIAALERQNRPEERVRKFGLELHPEKTRLIEFGRYAAERRAKCLRHGAASSL